jgi:hypothetical protein
MSSLARAAQKEIDCLYAHDHFLSLVQHLDEGMDQTAVGNKVIRDILYSPCQAIFWW